MKIHILLMSLSLFFLSQNSFAQFCDKNKILGLMAKKKVINLNDRSVCLDMHDFPSIRIKMKDQNYGLDKNRVGDSPSKQDESVKNIVGILNNSKVLEHGEKFTVITKGIADGTYNGAPNPSSETYAQDKQEESTFLASISDAKGAIDPKLVQKVLSYDPNGAKAIISAIDELYARKKNKVPFTQIDESEKDFVKANTRLKSLVRNSSRARARGEFLCTKIFGDPKACDSQGEISPNLDSGEHSFKGCCDGRRGAVIDIVPPDSLLKSKAGNGTFQPNFRRPPSTLQTKMNLAASMSVFKLDIPQDEELERQVIKEKNFSHSTIKQDKKRFAQALKGTGCENNQFAIDSVRRIYWQVKSQQGVASSELMNAITSGNFSVVNKAFIDRNQKNKHNDLAVLASLSSGGNYLERASIPSSFHPDAMSSVGGMPTDALNCLDSSKALEHEMASNEGQEAQKAGVPFCQNKPTSINLDTRSVKKHVCSICNSGPQFDTSGNLHYTARHGNSQMPTDSHLPRSQRKQAIETFSNADTFENPLSMASMKHYRSYIIPNCGTSCGDSCACLKQPGLKERLKSSAEVIDFSTVPGTMKKVTPKYDGTKEEQTGSFACIYTPPVPDTCSINPMGGGKRDGGAVGSDKDICPLEDALLAIKPVGGDVKVDEKDLEAYAKNCQDLSFPDSEATCEQSIKTNNGGNQCFAVKHKNGFIDDESKKKSNGNRGSKATQQ